MEDPVTKIQNEILDQYANDENPRPWIVAFSGGKDSTLLLQLVWNALASVAPEARKRRVHVVCNNTLVENPTILAYVKTQLEKIKVAADAQSMPITVDHTTPSLQDRYWVNLIGRGYVAPNNLFRWCTERLKIKPTTKYIQDRVSRYGGVLLLLGTRKDESSTRARSMEKYEVKGRRLSRYPLPNAYVYSPIKDLSTAQVWEYLLEGKSAWNSDNNDLLAIYTRSSDHGPSLEKDVPFLYNKNTAPSGNSRFGCWVCTVVTKDRCMQGLIERGETWMEPLKELRDFLAETINRDDPNYNPKKYRMPVRRNLQEGLGPYWPRWREYILERLLRAQATIQEQKPDTQLITNQELVTIQVIWHRDFIYDYNVSATYNRVYGQKTEFRNIAENVKKEKLLLKEVCQTNERDYELINDLLKAQRNRILLVNRRGLQKDIENVLEESLYPTFTDVYRKSND